MSKTMKHHNPKLTLLCLFSFVMIALGCKKQDDFLNTKPNQALSVPSTLADLQTLLNDEDVFNRYYPALGELSTDDYFIDASYWLSRGTTEKNAYVWAKQIYSANANVADWSSPYQVVYYSNTILATLDKINTPASQQSQYNNVKGSALFFRAFAFYNLVQTFAMPYDSTSADKNLGVPLPLVPDLGAKLSRATESQCFNQIITDLNNASSLLPDIPARKTQPSKAAVLGLLSRIYLVMGNYTQSLKNAKDFLGLYSQLQDYNKLNPSAFPVYPNYSPEEVFHAGFQGYTTIGFSAQVDSSMYKSFNDKNDLRPDIFFYNSGGEFEFNSQFDFNNTLSCTISTNEIYFNKAECEARLNDQNSAMADLNTLLLTRWRTGTYKPLTATSPLDALIQTLKERRKDLLFTGLRWSDLRRLNKDSRFAVTLYRNINGVSYSLPPNDPRYALPIPDNELQLNPMPQNSR